MSLVLPQSQHWPPPMPTHTACMTGSEALPVSHGSQKGWAVSTSAWWAVQHSWPSTSLVIICWGRRKGLQGKAAASP